MRGLRPQFMKDLKDGVLSPFRDRVLADRSLCLEIRNNYVNIYYRGGRLLKLSVNLSGGYTASFNSKYAEGDDGAPVLELPESEKPISTSSDASAALEMIPVFKQTMDLATSRRQLKKKREAQQLILRDNNFGAVSRATDYYICDIEYDTNSHGRFDLVAVHWPSDGATRKEQRCRRLVFIEVKYGDKAIDGSAGISSHIKKINRFIEDPANNIKKLKEEMVGLFNQKKDLGLKKDPGLIDCEMDLVSFSDEPPMLLLVLVNHDPDKSKLEASLKALLSGPYAEIYIATGCFMGYGLFDQAIVPLKEALSRFKAYI